MQQDPCCLQSDMYQLFTAYVDQILISTGAAQITAVLPLDSAQTRLHTALTVQLKSKRLHQKMTSR